MKIKVRISRGEGEKKSFQRFEVEVGEGMTFLSLLQKIKEEVDPSLSFRQFCRAGICGTCAITINGFPKLACKEQVLPYAMLEEEVTLEPLEKFPVIRDLAVDSSEMVEEMRRLRTWISGFRGDVRIPPELSRRIEKSADCILCLACQSHCPQTLEEDYAGPLYFAKIYRFLEDPRDSEGGVRLKRAIYEGKLFHCLSCNKCNNVCPKEVEPATLIRELMTYTDTDGQNG
jgi:NADH-dependent fumarate reductase subunit B